MKFHVGPRRSGKTRRLIEMALEEQRRGRIVYVVVANHDRAHQIMHMAEAISDDVRLMFPLTYHELASGIFCGTHIDGFFIDDVDDFLRNFARGVPIIAVTGTVTETAMDEEDACSGPTSST